MIRHAEFKLINDEVMFAINEAFDFAINNEKNKNDYILFLCNASIYEGIASGYNPYVINNEIDKLKDRDRLNFLIKYIRNHYSFKIENTVDSKLSISIEMMIYTHTWESIRHLKLLKQLSNLCDSQDYNWNIKVPSYPKRPFITGGIRDVFKKHSLKIHEVMTAGFHSSLRNAFAHSEYVFSDTSPYIELLNYKGEFEGELQGISLDDWTKRFCYTFLLNFRLIEKYFKVRSNLISGGTGYEVFLKDKDGNQKMSKLFYDKNKDTFRTNK